MLMEGETARGLLRLEKKAGAGPWVGTMRSLVSEFSAWLLHPARLCHGPGPDWEVRTILSVVRGLCF